MEVFRSEVQDHRRQLNTRTEEVEIMQTQLMTSEVMQTQLMMSEATCVWAERERNYLAEEVSRLAQEKAEAMQLAFDMQDDFDIESRRHGVPQR